MPLSLQQAADIVKKNLPEGTIQASVSYKGVYLFRVNVNLPFEENLDPFFSVDQNTGEFKDFSIITDGNPEIAASFAQAKKGETDGS